MMTASLAITTTVSTESLDAIIARMERLDQVVSKFAALIEERAKQLVPVVTGRLQREIHTELNGMVADIISDTPYAVPVEYGTHNRPAKPYMRPAIEAYAAEFVAAITAALGG